jgi:hypothetical protein
MGSPDIVKNNQIVGDIVNLKEKSVLFHLWLFPPASSQQQLIPIIGNLSSYHLCTQRTTESTHLGDPEWVSRFTRKGLVPFIKIHVMKGV